MKPIFLTILALCLFLATIQSQDDLPIGQQLIDNCLLPDMQDLIPCYQDSDCATLMQNYQTCVGSDNIKLSPQNLNNIQTCINGSTDTDNSAFSKVLTDEQSCVNVLTQLEDSPEALQEFHACKKQSKVNAQSDQQLGSCALGCFFMMDPNDPNSQNSGKGCVLQCYLNSFTFAQFEQCVSDVSEEFEDQIKLSLKKHKKKLLKKMFQEQSETLGQQLVNDCLVPAMTNSAACVSNQDCLVLSGQFNKCIQGQDAQDLQSQQACVDQYSNTQNALFKKVLQTQENCISLQNEVADNPVALANVQKCQKQFSKSLPQDQQLQMCELQCLSSQTPAACIIDCVQNCDEFKTLESCLSDIDELDASKIVLKKVSTKKMQRFQENTDNITASNQTFGQQLVDNCLVPAVSAEMQCIADPDCPYLAKALGECVKKAGKTDFIGQAGCLSQFSSTLNINFKALLDVAQVCLPYEEQLFDNSQAYKQSKACQKTFKKNVKSDLSIFECAAGCQSQQFTTGQCTVQCVLNATSFQDFETCIENLDLNNTESQQKFGDEYMSTCFIPTMTDMILCVQDPECSALEQSLLQTCDQNQPKMIDYNFTEALDCIGNFSSAQTNSAFNNTVMDMYYCLNLFSQLQENKKALKKFKSCNHTFESSLSGDDEVGQCYISCAEQNGFTQDPSAESDCLISCVNQTSEFTDFQDCLNQIKLSSDYNTIKLSDVAFNRANINMFITSTNTTVNSTNSTKNSTTTTQSKSLSVPKIIFNLALLTLSAVFLLFF